MEDGTAGVVLVTIFTAATHTGTKDYGVNNIATVQVVAVNVVDARLL
jgi:hypothetical protein